MLKHINDLYILLVKAKKMAIGYLESRDHKKDMNEACALISYVAFWVISISFVYCIVTG